MPSCGCGTSWRIPFDSTTSLWLGRTDEAVEYGNEARDGFAAIDDATGELRAVATLSRALLAAGKLRQARDLLATTQEEFSADFKGSPMKRAKLRGLKRNAAVVLGNVGREEDVDVLTRALDDAEPFVLEHAAWALPRLDSPGSPSRSGG